MKIYLVTKLIVDDSDGDRHKIICAKSSKEEATKMVDALNGAKDRQKEIYKSYEKRLNGWRRENPKPQSFSDIMMKRPKEKQFPNIEAFNMANCAYTNLKASYETLEKSYCEMRSTFENKIAYELSDGLFTSHEIENLDDEHTDTGYVVEETELD